MDIDIFSSGTGWITPKGEFIGCGFYDHIPTIMKHEEVEKIDGIREIQERLDDVYQDCMDLAASDEHPDWHRYDFAESDARSDIRDILLHSGFIRIGTNLMGGYVEAEGEKSSIDNKIHLIKKIAKEHSIVKNKELGVITTSIS